MIIKVEWWVFDAMVVIVSDMVVVVVGLWRWRRKGAREGKKEMEGNKDKNNLVLVFGKACALNMGKKMTKLDGN